MGSMYMISMIEKLLPSSIQHQWVRKAQQVLTSLIHTDCAKRLGLHGKEIFLDITKVGNQKETVNSRMYDVPFVDLEGNACCISACGIDELTASVEEAHIFGVPMGQ
ncbi:hypothetical protein E2C01_003578 [Portunus trituberculatus]|uniref:Uncharacterized protein n=1 Tax=Portunus trituberculatus TaxID=210409 RepID=A0A5B7CQI5_PORTR|nr:hypothetical protein [Portunus trituberculatus]